MRQFDPSRQFISILASLLVAAYVIRWAYELVRPALPVIVAVVAVGAVIRLTLAWRRRY